MTDRSSGPGILEARRAAADVDPDPLSERACWAEQLPRDALVDDSDVGRPLPVREREVATLEQADPEAVEEAGADPIHDGGDRPGRRRRRGSDRAVSSHAAAEGTGLGEPRRTHSRKAPHALDELLAEEPEPLGRVALVDVLHGEQHNAVLLEARVDALVVLERPHQQRRAHLQQQRERDLGDHQRPAGLGPAGPARGAAALERAEQVQPCRLQGGSETEQERGDHRQARAEAERAQDGAELSPYPGKSGATT